MTCTEFFICDLYPIVLTFIVIISELIAIVVCQLQLQVWPLMTRDTDCKLYLSPLLPLTAILSVFNFALICYWVPEDRHHLVHAQPRDSMVVLRLVLDIQSEQSLKAVSRSGEDLISPVGYSSTAVNNRISLHD